VMHLKLLHLKRSKSNATCAVQC